MKKVIQSLGCVLFAIFALLFTTVSVSAQDATKVDPDHYKVEFENDLVRIVRISYDPGEKSVMHEHPDGVVVFLTEGGETTFTFPDGSTEVATTKSGIAAWSTAVTHLPENTGDKPLEAILIEFKIKPEMASKTD